MNKITSRILVVLVAIMTTFSILSFIKIKAISEDVDLIEYMVSDVRIGVIDLQDKVDYLKRNN